MRVLQLDLESIAFKPLEHEAEIYESTELNEVRVSDALTLFVAIEQDDTEEEIKQAANDAVAFAKRQKVKNIVVYPFAHLSQHLQEPRAALKLFHALIATVKQSGINTFAAPFGWNKKLSITLKGYPLAEQLRVYGTVHKPKKRLKVDTAMVKKSEFSGLPDRDHRTIGTKLDLFSFQDVSAGMVYWHPKGLVMYRELVKFERELNAASDYSEISTPVLANVALWHASGHMEKYMDDMFLFDSESEQLGMKPMNCPATMLIYNSTSHSYRDLPLRLSCFDKLYRNEISGALTGLFRVREITQDDAHLFVREEQVEQEISSILKTINTIYATFGMEYTAKLSTMPEKHLGDEALWEVATSKLKQALDANKIKYTINEKDGAFYGPKIDLDVLDSMNRSWQCGTIQLDYQLPQRLKTRYTDEQGTQQTPVVLHRAIMGSVERFIGILVEHYQGKFPLWLAPVQVRVVSISKQSNEYAEKIYSLLKKAQIRTEIDITDKTLEHKIRDAQLQYVPYVVVVGKKEADASTIAVRTVENKQKFGVKPEEFLHSLKEQIAKRSATLEL